MIWGERNTTDTLVCSESNAGNLSVLCTNGPFDKRMCIHNFDEQFPYRIGLGVYGLFVVFFGCFGNLFTLISLPYAAKKQR